jgi:DNA adenine methylase
MSDEEHEALARVLHSSQARVAVSGYRCPLMDRLYEDWRRFDAPPRHTASSRRRGAPESLRQQILWTNSDPNPLVLFEHTKCLVGEGGGG